MFFSDELRKYEASEKRKQRDKKLLNDAMGTRQCEAEKKQQVREKLKTNITKTERIKKFKRAVIFGPIFTCSCCHMNHFESNVALVDEELRVKILTTYPECFVDCVQEFVKVLTKLPKFKKSWCIKNLKVLAI